MLVDKFCIWNVLVVGLFSIIAVQANNIELLGEHLLVHWEVIENPTDFTNIKPHTGVLTLTNTGPADALGSDWEIYFCSVRLMFPTQLRGTSPDFGHPIGDTKISLYHLNGCLHKLKPKADFEGFLQNAGIRLPFEAADWSVSRTDVMPRWYITDGTGSMAMTIASTSNEELDFVADFDTAAKWKRLLNIDQYDPFSPEVRFNRNKASDQGEPQKRVIPTPVSATFDDTMSVDIASGDWVVVYSSEDVKNVSEFLAAKWNTEAIDISSGPTNRYVQINMADVDAGTMNNEEAYTVTVIPEMSVINITGTNTSGAFYGVQTLLSLYSYSTKIPKAEILDYPRFPYRGMHIDVGRNFYSKEDILKLLDAMAMYKLNKFYFHLTEDEGWRLEIDGLPELTDIGSQRCFDLDEDQCIISQLGSGPTTHTSGSGYYTKEDYREILRYANERHIQVTPEFDMPGHVHAGIKAMEARYRASGNTDTEYLLTDFEDNSNYLSIQLFRDNAVNPCIPSTYNFVRKVMQAVVDLHEDIQPLKAFNFGGDEVPHDAWVNSTACNTLIKNNPELAPDEYTSKNTILQRYFVRNVSAIAQEFGLDIAGWEDGFKFNNSAMERTDLPNENAYVFAWNNVWEWGNGARAYEYANEGYKVVISHATHFYYDHPQEPDPEERGFYWATRFTDMAKTFGYYPDDVYENIEENLFGEPLNKEDFCDPEKCEPLEERSNIIGIQGCLWSETVRTSEQLDQMIFPRMLAMAERAWHKASWEDLAECGTNCESLKATDWEEFANSLGHKELKRLSQLGIQYYVPPPGARVTEEDGSYKLEVNVDLPGQPVVYSTNNGDTWQTIKAGTPVTMDSDQQIHINVRSVDLQRSGRSVMLETGRPVSGQCQLTTTWSLIFVNLLLVMAWFI